MPNAASRKASSAGPHEEMMLRPGATTPDSLERINGSALRVRWQDGHESVYPVRYLRQRCPCAGCVDELSGRRLLTPESVPADLQAPGAALVGNYAVSFSFSDGHGSGIYTFEALRRLCPCAECALPRPEAARP